MNIDLNLTITGIIALSAVLSPICTCLIDNWYKSKRENIQTYELAKRQALVNFIKYANYCHQHNNSNNISEYISSLNNLYIYFSNVPNEIHKLGNVDFAHFEKELNSITIKLAKQIKQK